MIFYKGKAVNSEKVVSRFGKQNFIKDSFGVAEKYLEIAQADEQTALALKKNRLFNQAGYFFIQAMEKQIKHHIAKKINAMNPYFAEELRKTTGYSLDESLKLLFKVYTGNDEVLFNQLNEQIRTRVFREVNFSTLHNKVRYPIYNPKYQSYAFLELSARDCETLQDTLTLLKKYLEEISRRVS